MIKLVTLTLVFATVYCGGDNWCCYPDKWQTTVHGIVDWGTLFVEYYANVYFDTPNERIRVDVGGGEPYSELLLYKESAGYMFNKTYCEKFNPGNWSEEPIIHCIPKSANASQKYKLGFPPGINLVDYTWSLRDDIYADVGITDKCTPVLVTLTSFSQKDIYLEVDEYQNFLPKADPSHFIVPEQCKNKTEISPLMLPRGNFHFRNHNAYKVMK